MSREDRSNPRARRGIGGAAAGVGRVDIGVPPFRHPADGLVRTAPRRCAGGGVISGCHRDRHQGWHDPAVSATRNISPNAITVRRAAVGLAGPSRRRNRTRIGLRMRPPCGPGPRCGDRTGRTEARSQPRPGGPKRRSARDSDRLGACSAVRTARTSASVAMRIRSSFGAHPRACGRDPAAEDEDRIDLRGAPGVRSSRASTRPMRHGDMNSPGAPPRRARKARSITTPSPMPLASTRASTSAAFQFASAHGVTSGATSDDASPFASAARSASTGSDTTAERGSPAERGLQIGPPRDRSRSRARRSRRA